MGRKWKSHQAMFPRFIPLLGTLRLCTIKGMKGRRCRQDNVAALEKLSVPVLPIASEQDLRVFLGGYNQICPVRDIILFAALSFLTMA